MAQIKKINNCWPPEPTVAAVIYHEGKFLMVEELADGVVVYNQPAGHLEPNETPLEAIKRETLEETACDFLPSALIGVYFFTSPSSGVTYQRICFAGQIVKHYPSQPLDKGIIKATWMTRTELVKERNKLRSPMVLQCIDDFLANKRYPLDLIIHL